MQRLPFVAVTVLVVTLAWSATALRSTGQQPVLPDPVVQKWEYKIVTSVDKEMNERLNKLGGEGWELTAVEPANQLSSARYVFKRRVNSM